jgi:hypothetical protein
MKIRFPNLKRASWRERFVEIARQVEAGSAPRSLVIAARIRARARIASPKGLTHVRLEA